MDTCYHVKALREVRLVGSGAHPTRIVRAGVVIRCGDKGLARPTRPPARLVNYVRIDDRGRSGCNCRDQTKANHMIDLSKAQTAAKHSSAHTI